MLLHAGKNSRWMTHMDHSNFNYIMETVNCLWHILYKALETQQIDWNLSSI